MPGIELQEIMIIPFLEKNVVSVDAAVVDVVYLTRIQRGGNGHEFIIFRPSKPDRFKNKPVRFIVAREAKT